MEGEKPSLADVLELLYTARSRYRTVRLELLGSSRPHAQHEAMQRLTGRRASQIMIEVGGGGPDAIPEVIETRLRLSGEPPGRWRVEREDGNGASLTVSDGDTWWTYHPRAGAMTNFGDAAAPGRVTRRGDADPRSVRSARDARPGGDGRDAGRDRGARPAAARCAGALGPPLVRRRRAPAARAPGAGRPAPGAVVLRRAGVVDARGDLDRVRHRAAARDVRLRAAEGRERPRRTEPAFRAADDRGGGGARFVLRLRPHRARGGLARARRLPAAGGGLRDAPPHLHADRRFPARERLGVEHRRRVGRLRAGRVAGVGRLPVHRGGRPGGRRVRARRDASAADVERADRRRARRARRQDGESRRAARGRPFV